MCTGAELIMLGGAGVSAAGKMFEGVAGANAHDLSSMIAGGNADLLRTQAQIAAGNADLAVTRGNYDEFRTRQKGEAVLASETAHYASGNVDPTYGSPLVLQGYSAAQVETDAQLIRARMMVERADALTTSANIYGQAAGQRFKQSAESMAAKTSLIAGEIGAATSLLSAGSKWPGLNGGAPGSAPAVRGGISGDDPFLLHG